MVDKESQSMYLLSRDTGSFFFHSLRVAESGVVAKKSSINIDAVEMGKSKERRVDIVVVVW